EPPGPLREPGGRDGWLVTSQARGLVVHAARRMVVATGGRLLLLGQLGDHRFGGQEQAGDGRSVLDRSARDLRRVDDTGLDACSASSTRAFLSLSSVSVAAPTLMTATPPASLARRSWSFSRS